jgi:predicted metal-dependent hydrolase
MHELAHLRHKDHEWKFYRFYIELMKWYVKRKRK